MGPLELTGMEVPKVARQRFLDDLVSHCCEGTHSQAKDLHDIR
jgi:hypothetical protein